jgi:hypothetical protein
MGILSLLASILCRMRLLLALTGCGQASVSGSTLLTRY